MKRLTLLAVTAILSLFLVACGDNAEKKVEKKADTEMNQQENKNQSEQAKPDEVKPEEAKPDQSKLDDANKDVNNELSAAAISSANQQVAQNGSDNVTTLASEAAAQSLPQSA